MAEKVNPMDRILSAEDKQQSQTTAEPNGLLARFWRMILRDLNFTTDRWANSVTNYIEMHHTRENPKTSVRGSLNKEFALEGITFKTFLSGLKIIGVLKARITIDLEWPGKKTTTHELRFSLVPDELREVIEERHRNRYKTKTESDKDTGNVFEEMAEKRRHYKKMLMDNVNEQNQTEKGE